MRLASVMINEKERIQELARQVGEQLIEKGITISACESCTGGMFTASLVGVPGMSAVFDRGLVTYSNKAKMEELGVKAETLEAYTAESPEVAGEMARGLSKKTGSRICISSTGVAGPGPLGDIPSGSMWVGMVFDVQMKVISIRTGSDDREYNREVCTRVMLSEILKILPNIN